MCIEYERLGIDGTMYMMDMWCFVYIVSCTCWICNVHIVLCTCWICGVVCIWCCVHVGYAVLCTYGAMYMLYMHLYVHMVLRACCTCGAMYIWCCVHDCTRGVVSMWCPVNVLHVLMCACHVVYMSCMWCRRHVVHIV